MLNNALGLGFGAGARTKVHVFIANGTLVAGRTVSLDPAKTGEDRARYVIEGGADDYVVGVALEAATAGSEVRVATAGYLTGVLTDGNVTAGGTLVAAASGALGLFAGTESSRPLGVSFEADSTTTSGGIFLFDLYGLP